MNDKWNRASNSEAQNPGFVYDYSSHSKSRDSLIAPASDEPRGFSAEEISEYLLNVVRMLEDGKTAGIKKSIKVMLKKIPAMYAALIPTWKDNNDMDLLHHVIVNNSPDTLDFLLSESNWFPATYMPTENPYAHLAAVFGHTECLRRILNYRPNDYFSGSIHTLRLPSTIQKKVKLTDTMKKGVKRQINKLLGKIQMSADIVENSILQDKGGIKDVDNTLAEELRVLEANKKVFNRGINNIKSTQLMRRNTTGASGSRRQEGANSNKHTSKDSNEATKAQDSGVRAKDTPIAREGARDVQHPVYKKSSVGAVNKKHMISVYSDAFSDGPQGVVQGAGQKVIVKYSEDIVKSKPEKSSFPEIVWPSKNLSLLPVISVQKVASKLPVDISKPTQLDYRPRAESVVIFPKKMEAGVRGKGKYKEFQLKIESRKVYPKDNAKNLRNKTPLSLAAEYGHLDCVQMILDTYILRNYPTTAVKEPLTLATKAKSPDTILFLMNQRISVADYQSAVLTAIREMYPECLTALLAQKTKERQSLFDGVNLYHVLYTQSLMTDYRYEMLPIMTSVLISNNVDVNAHKVYSTFPLYTLINCAFHVSIEKQIFYFLKCLKMLLDSKANPHYDELRDERFTCTGQSFSRKAYSSAINCILLNAVDSTHFLPNIRSCKLYMKKLISLVTTYDRTNRRTLNDVLFNYMDTVCVFGIDRYIVRCLLRYGANPDFNAGNKYAINVYFNNILPYLAKFEVEHSFDAHENEVRALMAICNRMTYKCLKDAQLIFLNENLLQCPVQALPLIRHFSYELNEILMSPRSLLAIVAQFIWLRFRRNDRRVKELPLPDDLIACILP
ncbi:hypothetical protein BsWGS_01373 [Bradybaena similaris]